MSISQPARGTAPQPDAAAPAGPLPDAPACEENLSPRALRTRQRILDAAHEVFEEKGYAGANIDDIIKRCKVARGTFYLYFRNKEHIFTMVVEQVGRKLHDDTAAQPPVPMSHRDRLAFANRTYLEAFRANRKMLGELIAYAPIIPEISEVELRLRDDMTRRVKQSLDRYEARGQLRDVDTEIASRALGGMIQSLAFEWLSRDSYPFGDDRFEDVVKAVSDLWYWAVFKPGE
ncbi:MAG: TetR/AcrR family transcriptional regulator [Dehalococcoidia bacterium]|nr:TetR/AcrR family transcriptional regulator [Dehalococcoidia bacterium]